MAVISYLCRNPIHFTLHKVISTTLEHIFGSGDLLNKEQSVFYDRTTEIKKLQMEYDALKEKINQHTGKLQALYIPFLDQFQHLKTEQVLVLSDCLDKMKFSRHHKKALTEVLIQECHEVLEKSPEHKDILLLLRSLGGERTELVKKNACNKTQHAFQQFFEFSFEEKEEKEIPEWEAEKEAAKQKRLAQQKEKQKKEETISVKEIYRTLLKAYHPDKEQDEEQKIRKTEITQKIIEAYQKEDVYRLLSFEMELLADAKSRMNSIATDKLSVYNKLLLENKQTLESKIAALKSDHPEVYKNMCTPHSNPERYLKKTKKELLQELEQFKKQILMLRGSRELVEVFTDSYLNDAQQRFYF